MIFNFSVISEPSIYVGSRGTKGGYGLQLFRVYSSLSRCCPRGAKRIYPTGYIVQVDLVWGEIEGK